MRNSNKKLRHTKKIGSSQKKLLQNGSDIVASQIYVILILDLCNFNFIEIDCEISIIFC